MTSSERVFSVIAAAFKSACRVLQSTRGQLLPKVFTHGFSNRNRVDTRCNFLGKVGQACLYLATELRFRFCLRPELDKKFGESVRYPLTHEREGPAIPLLAKLIAWRQAA